MGVGPDLVSVGCCESTAGVSAASAVWGSGTGSFSAGSLLCVVSLASTTGVAFEAVPGLLRG